MNILPGKDYFRSVINLSYPVVLGMMARTVMGLVDVIMVGQLGVAQLAATGLAFHLVLLFVYSFGTFNVGVQALTSRRYGEQKYEQCGSVINGTMLFIALIGLIGSVAGYIYSPALFHYLTDDPKVYEYGSVYVRIRFLEMFAMSFLGLNRGFFDGIGKTTVYMKSMIVMNALNIILNYMLIYGKFGMPRLEVTGAALGSMISSYAGAIIFTSFGFYRDIRRRFGLYSSLKPDFIIIKRLFRLSVPVMFQTVIIFAGFLTFLKIVGMISTVALAASNVCMNIISVSFMPGFGLGIAAATFVGQNLGAKKPDLAEQMASEAVKLGVLFMGFLGIIFLIVPGPILRLFTPDREIIMEGIVLLRIIGVVQFIDAVGIILSNVLRGAGMTMFVMLADIGCIWGLFVPATYILGILFGLNSAGAWIAMALYVLVFAVIMLLAFKKGTWKVIEI